MKVIETHIIDGDTVIYITEDHRIYKMTYSWSSDEGKSWSGLEEVYIDSIASHGIHIGIVDELESSSIYPELCKARGKYFEKTKPERDERQRQENENMFQKIKYELEQQKGEK